MQNRVLRKCFILVDSCDPHNDNDYYNNDNNCYKWKLRSKNSRLCSEYITQQDAVSTYAATSITNFTCSTSRHCLPSSLPPRRILRSVGYRPADQNIRRSWPLSRSDSPSWRRTVTNIHIVVLIWNTQIFVGIQWQGFQYADTI